MENGKSPTRSGFHPTTPACPLGSADGAPVGRKSEPWVRAHVRASDRGLSGTERRTLIGPFAQVMTARQLTVEQLWPCCLGMTLFAGRCRVLVDVVLAFGEGRLPEAPKWPG